MARPAGPTPSAPALAGGPPHAVIIGGGLGGIAAALCLRHKGWSVTLLEAGPHLAAGWGSRDLAGEPWDLGLRIPAESGTVWADDLLFHDLPGAPLWNRLGRIAREGGITAGRLNADTGCPDATTLGAAALEQIRFELIERAFSADPGAEAPSAAERLAAIYGPTLASGLLADAARALLGRPPEALAWNALANRLPARVVVACTEETDRLRRIGALGARIAHPSARGLPSNALDDRSYLYPSRGGIGRWAEALRLGLEQQEVTLRLGQRVTGCRLAGERIEALTLASGETIPGTLFVLTAAPGALPLALPPAPPAAGAEVEAWALRFAGASPPDLHWVTSYDPATAFQRLGFPDRLAGQWRQGEPWRLLAELRPGAAADLPARLPEWTGLGLLPAAARLLSAEPIGTGRFAVETPEAARCRREALGALGGLSNLVALGSAQGGHSLVPGLISDAAQLAESHAARRPTSRAASRSPASAAL
jgi:hypothetical protein